MSKILKPSVAPIFCVFQTVEELRMATTKKINEFHTQYIKGYSTVNSEFLTYGIAYIQFAKEYPLLFETIMLSSCIDYRKRYMNNAKSNIIFDRKIVTILRLVSYVLSNGEWCIS